MKIFLTILFCTCVLAGRAQDKSNIFHIVDADTKKAIPYASVSMARSKVAINTETDGLLTIPGNIAATRDTIFITVQNYLPLKMPLRLLNGRDSIPLKKAFYQPLNLTAKTSGKDSVLNNFNPADVGYFAGIHTVSARFEYLQLAQLFSAPAEGALLKKLFIYRLAHPRLIYGTELSQNQNMYVDLEHTKFRIRIYDVDKNGAPGRDLCSEIIEVKNNSDPDLPVNLADYKIIIPGKSFFVAIEWIRCYDNAGYAMQRAEENLIYKPSIGISPVKSQKLNMWGLTYGRKWQPFTYFSPDWTDLAITAEMVW